jgi:phage N-6-adenine-methyltransferase
MSHDKWQTPTEFYDALNAEFGFNHDPCPIDWEVGDPDGLHTRWKERNYVNPPYSNTGGWIAKARKECDRGRLCVLLVNAVTDTRAFHEHVVGNPKAEVRFIKGRLKFTDATDPTRKTAQNPRPSILIIFRPE